MEPFVMSVNNAGAGHSAHWWADDHPTLRAIYFDGDEHPHVAPVGALFVLYVVRKDAASAVGGIGRVIGTPRHNARGQWGTEVACIMEMICPADEFAPLLSERGIDGSACRPARRLDPDDFRHFALSLAMSTSKRALALAAQR
jgi:hypothetical protein